MPDPGILSAAIAISLPVCRIDKRPACPHGFKDAAILARAIKTEYTHPDALS